MTYGLDEKVEAEMPLVDISFLKKQNYDLPFIEKVQVRSTNIDYIHHTNNIEYIKFLLNTVSVSELEEHPVTELEIHYATQTFEGDTLGIYAKKNADKALFEIKKEEQSVMKCVMWY